VPIAAGRLEEMIAERFGPSTPKAVSDLGVLPTAVDEALREGRKAFKEAKLVAEGTPPLWPKPYAELTYEARCRFIYECIYTWHDQARKYLRVEEEAYISWYIWHWHDTRLRGEPLIVEKARRMLITWITRALELHDLGVCRGGLLIAGQDYGDASGFVNRISVLYEQLRLHFPAWGLREPETWGPAGREKIEVLALPNGSLIEAINQEPESFRGQGITMVSCEELSAYRNIEKAWGQAIAICQADPGVTSGHKTAICNASPQNEWTRLKEVPEADEALSDLRRRYPIEDEPPAPNGCRASITISGSRLLEIDYWADPGKTDEWFERETRGVPVRVVRQEWLRDCTVYDGEPVYQDFREPIHCPEFLRRNSWPVQSGSSYVLGLDIGQTLSPAGVLLEISPFPGCQIVAIGELAALGNEPASRFVPRAMGMLMARLGGKWDEVEWVADPDVRRREANYGKSYGQVARSDHGIEIGIAPKGASLHARLAAVDWALSGFVTTLDRFDKEVEAPRFFVCGKDCPTLLAALRGGYRNRPPLGGPGTGRDARDPVKDIHSHIANGLEYAMLRARQIALGL
jgi:hypothetical protein